MNGTSLKNILNLVLITASACGLIEAIFYIHVKSHLFDSYIAIFLFICRDVFFAILVLNCICYLLALIILILNRIFSKKDFTFVFIAMFIIIYVASWANQNNLFHIKAKQIASIPKVSLLFVLLISIFFVVGVYYGSKYLGKLLKKIKNEYKDNIYLSNIPVAFITVLMITIANGARSKYAIAYKIILVFAICFYMIGNVLFSVLLKRSKGKYIFIILNLIVLLIVIYSFTFSGDALLRTKIADTKKYPNILLLSVDALRQDHVSSYIKGKAFTPNIDRIAEDGILFENAYTAASWTVPSCSSLVTSLYPSAIGQLTGGNDLFVPDEIKTFPEILADYGYHNYIIPYPVTPWKNANIEQGFINLSGYFRRTWYKDVLKNMIITRSFFREVYIWKGEVLNEHIIHNLKYIQEPFFIWAHYLDAHAPYTLSEIAKDALIQRANGLLDFLDIRSGIFQLNKSEKERLKKFYALEVEYVDKQIGDILDLLAKKNLYNNSLIIITSDHGEEFWEHGSIAHGHSLYGEILKIPLIVKFPERNYRNIRSKSHVNLLDIAPTILNYLDIKEAYQFQGEDLVEIVNNPDKFEERILFAENNLYFYEQKAAIKGNYKLIISDEGTMLFDLTADPEERYQLYDEERINELSELILKWQKDNAAFYKSNNFSIPKYKPYEEEMNEILKSLGYAK